MRQHLTRLKLISAFVLACVVSPAFTGFAAAAACPGDAMPCCAHRDPVPSVNAGCCRIAPAPAPARTPVAPPTSDSDVALSPAPFAATMPAAVEGPSLASTARGPASPRVPLYIALSDLRR